MQRGQTEAKMHEALTEQLKHQREVNQSIDRFAESTASDSGHSRRRVEEERNDAWQCLVQGGFTHTIFYRAKEAIRSATCNPICGAAFYELANDWFGVVVPTHYAWF